MLSSNGVLNRPDIGRRTVESILGMAVEPRDRAPLLDTRSMLLNATVPASMANGASLVIFKRPGLAPCAPRADTNLDTDARNPGRGCTTDWPRPGDDGALATRL
jgi:hypothetical protein